MLNSESYSYSTELITSDLQLYKNFSFGKNTVKPLITNTWKEFIKCRILHFMILECCRYLGF